MRDTRPLRADARQNRERVLNAASTAFAAEGLSVPLDEIARRAGVGPGTLYRHFPTKEALFEAVVHDRLRGLVSEGTALRDSPDPGVAFFAFIEHLAAEAGLKRDLFDALASAGVDAGPAVMAAADELRAQIACLLGEAQQAGAVRADIGSAELTALLPGMFFAMRPRPGADRTLVLSVFRDGLRPQGRSHGAKPRPRAAEPGHAACRDEIGYGVGQPKLGK